MSGFWFAMYEILFSLSVLSSQALHFSSVFVNLMGLISTHNFMTSSSGGSSAYGQRLPGYEWNVQLSSSWDGSSWTHCYQMQFWADTLPWKCAELVPPAFTLNFIKLHECSRVGSGLSQKATDKTRLESLRMCLPAGLSLWHQTVQWRINSK